MTRVPLTGSAYAGKSIISSGQETINLYAEVNNADPESPVPVTWYPTAGTDLYATPNPANLNKVRGEYRTSIGTAYCVIGNAVYEVTIIGTLILLGNIANLPSQVYFSDNGRGLTISQRELMGIESLRTDGHGKGTRILYDLGREAGGIVQWFPCAMGALVKVIFQKVWPSINN